ncbi:MAG: MATE family efflux transporter [Bacteroidia bacterium]|nr:MATE family efflux transporter [Bacteroidia bacterium]MCX7651971.1 MATE family efflux transporter [Bacteroidia bacterium]MDW8416122.1 MATE family efflux transporter [Bacteroidia bacterium]
MEATYRQIWRIALPIMGASLAQNAVSLIDTAFLGLLGQAELAAGGLGVLFFLTIGFIGLGLGVGVQVLSAQFLGEKRQEQLGALLRQSLWLGTVIGIGLTFLMAYGSEPLIRALLYNPSTESTTIYFLRGRSLELFPLIIFGALRGYYSGTAQTGYIFRANILLAITNLLLNTIFVLGFEWGMKGVIAGSVLSQYLATAYLLLALKMQKYPLTRSGIRANWTLPLVRYAGPAILQHFVGMAGWVVFFLLIERRGQFALASANIVRSLYSFAMLPTWALSTAVGTLSGYFWGAKDKVALVNSLKRAFLLSQGLNALIASALSGLSSIWVKLFSQDIAIQLQAARDLHLIALAVLLMPASAMLLSAVVGVDRVIPAFFVEVGVILFYVGYATWLDRLGVELTLMWTTELTYWIPSAVVLYFIWRQQVKRLPSLTPAPAM